MASACETAGPAGRKLDKLERLGKLRDAGVLDPAELRREKQRLFGVPATSAGS